MVTLYADGSTGVHQAGDNFWVNRVYEDEQDFYKALDTLDDGEYIRCDVISQEMFDRINKEHGIH